MKMNFREHKKRSRKRLLQQVLFIVVFIGGIIFLDVTNRNPLSGITFRIAGPVITVKENIQSTFGNYTRLLQSKKRLVEENQMLRKELEKTTSNDTMLQLLREENERLKGLLGRNIEGDLILAPILGRPPKTPYDTFIIDAGSEDGIHLDDSVVAHGDFIIGFVSKVFPQTSQATLYSSPGVRTNVLIGENGVLTEAIGKGAGNFRAQLPRDAEVAQNDIVILEGHPSQVFAEVEEIIRNEVDAFQTLLFKNPVNIFSLREVLIVRSARER